MADTPTPEAEETVHQKAARRVREATREATGLLLEEGLERLRAGAGPMDVADCVNEACFFMNWFEKADGALRAYTEAATEATDNQEEAYEV